MAEKETRPSVWDPFAELDLLERWPFGRSRLARTGDDPWFARRGGFAPAVDITEDDDRYVVTCELPGTTRDDVTVEVQDNVLTLRGEKKSERDEKKEQRRYVERTFGSFSRSFTLPRNASGEKVHASFRDGVLTVEIPKAEEAKPKVVSIKS